jgi:hypothetical protein
MCTSYDQGMDVYVVLNIWKERSSVAGAGARSEDAEVIADRLGGNHRWTDWRDEPTPGQRSRRALWADGSTHPDHTQEIVRVPLAGGTPVSVIARTEIEEIGRAFGAP